VARGVSYERGERVRYTAAPVSDLIIQTGDVGVVERVEGHWVYAFWPTSGLHSVPTASVEAVDQLSKPWRVEFRWKELVIYWENGRGCVFDGAWGVDPSITIVPDADTWNAVVPPWLQNRHDELLERLRSVTGHIVKETPDYQNAGRTLEELTDDTSR
jgi:hypothetical protein